MPDTRKHILVEPETHKEFEKFKVENSLTQDSGVSYLVRQNRLLGKLDKSLYEKIKLQLT